MCAAQGLDFLSDPVGRHVAAVHAAIRSAIPHLDEDRALSADIAQATELIRAGVLVGASA
jgi:histidine ammonia-lyase